MPAEVFYRCGVTDRPSARGVVSRWGLKEVGYVIESRPVGADFDDAAYDQIIADGFAAVSAVCGLKFKRSQNTANILLRTGRGGRSNFDGPSGVLAWAELPGSDQFAGQLEMRFDLDEKWGKATGILISNVWRHELGHLCGLEHTNTPGQLLQPIYSPGIRTYQAEDISRLVERYGKPGDVTPPTPPVPPTSDRVAAKVSVGGKIYGGWLAPLPAGVTEF